MTTSGPVGRRPDAIGDRAPAARSELAEVPRRSMGERWPALPPWAAALLTHVVVRLVALPAVVLLWWSIDGSSLIGWFSAVDGHWYQRVVEDGYPRDLPVDPVTGRVGPSTVAFYPLFPLCVRALMTVTGLPFDVAGPLLGFAFGAAAAVVIAHLVRAAAPAAVARRPELPLLAVAAVNAFPSSAVLSFAYTEGLALLLVGAVLLLLVRGRYGWAILPVAALGFTRAVALPMAGVVLWQCWTRHRRGKRPALRELGAMVPFLVTATLSGFAWPVIVGWWTGRPNAFVETQGFWRDGGDVSTPFGGFVDRFRSHLPLSLSVLLVAALVGVVLAVAASRRVRELGPELQAWTACYIVYLIAVSDLDFSGLRFLIITITVPLLAVTWWNRRWVAITVLVLMMAGQYAWVWGIWGDRWPINP